MLFTKSIYKNPEPEDGLRVSVMSRHTKKDGITLDPCIQCYDLHVPSFGPSPKLIGRFYRDEIGWEDFKKEYIEQIRSNKETVAKIKIFAKLALTKEITLLCVEENAEDCHRGLLAKEFQRLVPSLAVKHR